jgi:hypothetical protein
MKKPNAMQTLEGYFSFFDPMGTPSLN